MRHTEARIARRAIAMTGLPLAASLLAACGSPSTPAATDPASKIPASRSAVTVPASPAAPAPATYTATGTAADSQGNKAAASISIGKPVAQISLTQTDLNACGVETQLNNDPDSTAAVPVQVTVTVTSSSGTPASMPASTSTGANVTLSLDGTNVVAPGGSVVISSSPPTWATGNGSSVCGSSNGGDLTLGWTGLEPGRPVTWSGWLLDSGANTSGDSGGAARQVVFLEPVVSFGNGNADFVAGAGPSQDLLNCAAGVQSGPVIAVNPGVARGDGCTAYTGS